MPTTAPHRYAIVIPTRNRQSYCVEAARSVASCDRADTQIVVADNSDDADLLPRLLAEAGLADRVDLLRAAATALPMRENWERALEAATADWICYIGDDDAMMPDGFAALDALTGQIDSPVFAWEPLDYRWPCYPGGSGGQLVLPSKPPAAAQVPAAAFLDQHRVWRTQDKWPAIGPSIYHGLVHRRFIDRLRRVHGRYFLNFVVDYASSIVNLTQLERFAYLRAPVTLIGACGSSNSAGLTADGRAASKFEETLAENPNLRPLYPELVGSRLHAPLVAAGYADLFGQLGMPFEMTAAKMLKSCVAELGVVTSVAAFERERALLRGFARGHGLDVSALQGLRFAPSACGVGLRGAAGVFVDTAALGWQGVRDVLVHVHALTPRFDASWTGAIRALARGQV